MESSKYLGVTINSNLTWGTHINTIAGKGNRTLGFIRRNLRDCSKRVKSAAYTSMVRPTVEYACSVWDPTEQKQVKVLEKVQKRAARFVHNNYTDRTPGCVTKMVRDLQWESLEQRRKNARLCMLHKIKHNLIDINKDEYLTPNDRRTRGADRYFQERTNCNIYAQTFFPKTIRDWNRLPASTTSANTVEGFRAALPKARSTTN